MFYYWNTFKNTSSFEMLCTLDQVSRSYVCLLQFLKGSDFYMPV